MKTKWHSGPPPSIGWWPASVAEDKETLRWWNGKHWSQPVHCQASSKVAAFWAKHKSAAQNFIYWSKPWWN